jgi:hypothetical protein
VKSKGGPKEYSCIHKGNPVARHMRTFNKAHVFKDRKAAEKRGHMKHRGFTHE